MTDQQTYNWPQQLSAADYQACCDAVIALAQKNPTVASVYLLGGTWHPGISDLDIIVVYKDLAVVEPVPGPWKISPHADFIFTHRYFSYDEKDFPLFFYFYPDGANVRLLWGNDLTIEKPKNLFSEKEYLDLQLFILFDVIVNKLLLMPSRLRSNPFSVRHALGELYSMKYSCTMVEQITAQRIGEEFIAQISALRKSWFNLDADEALRQLRALIPQGIVLITDIVSLVDAYLQSHFDIPTKKMRFTNASVRYLCTEQWSATAFMHQLHRSQVSVHIPFTKKRIQSNFLLLPTSFSYCLYVYASSNGLFSDKIRSSLSVNSPITLNAAVAQHVAAMNQVVASSNKRKGMYKVPYPFGFSSADNSLQKRFIASALKFYDTIRTSL